MGATFQVSHCAYLFSFQGRGWFVPNSEQRGWTVTIKGSMRCFKRCLFNYFNYCTLVCV